MNDIVLLLADELQDREARSQYLRDFLNAHIALQIKTLRQQRNLTQQALAELAGKGQSQISEMESIDCTSWKVSTLLNLAHAFDVALVVNFESFGEALGEISNVRREALEKPSFKDDPVFQGLPPTLAQPRPSYADDPAIVEPKATLETDLWTHVLSTVYEHRPLSATSAPVSIEPYGSLAFNVSEPAFFRPQLLTPPSSEVLEVSYAEEKYATTA